MPYAYPRGCGCNNNCQAAQIPYDPSVYQQTNYIQSWIAANAGVLSTKDFKTGLVERMNLSQAYSSAPAMYIPPNSVVQSLGCPDGSGGTSGKVHIREKITETKCNRTIPTKVRDVKSASQVIGPEGKLTNNLILMHDSPTDMHYSIQKQLNTGDFVYIVPENNEPGTIVELFDIHDNTSAKVVPINADKNKLLQYTKNSRIVPVAIERKQGRAVVCDISRMSARSIDDFIFELPEPDYVAVIMNDRVFINGYQGRVIGMDDDKRRIRLKFMVSDSGELNLKPSMPMYVLERH